MQPPLLSPVVFAFVVHKTLKEDTKHTRARQAVETERRRNRCLKRQKPNVA